MFQSILVLYWLDLIKFWVSFLYENPSVLSVQSFRNIAKFNRTYRSSLVNTVEYKINFNEILKLVTEIWNADVSAAQRKLFWSIDNRQNTYLTTAAKYVTVCV
jgi:hypothetical protein